MAQLEICVDTLDGAKAAIAGGASRIELCSSLSEGGLTPSAGLMQAAATLPVPCYAMIRPRCGLFFFTKEDIDIMHADIRQAKQAGLAGVVLGVQKSDGSLDEDTLRNLIASAGDLEKTLHRVIDVVPDPLAALATAIGLGFDRVLTSGAQPLAPDGIGLIKAMVEHAHDKISIMPGCGLTADNVSHLIQQTGVYEVHAACSAKAMGDPAFSDFDPPSGRYETSTKLVQKMVDACHAVGFSQ